MDVRRISILGVGLLGGSIGLACRSRLKNCEIVGYGHRRESLEQARQMGAIDRIAESPDASVKDAQIVVLCTPVSKLGPMIAKIAPAVAEGAIVTDVGSTKESVVLAGEEGIPSRAHFVGSHPMAGSEKRGVQFARADLFEKALCILTPTARTAPTALDQVELFWQTLGMRTTRLSPDLHDRYLAEVSHLPHALAAALVLLAESEALDVAGNGFLDMTRIAGGDGGLWRDILLDNRLHVCAAIGRLKMSLTGLAKMLRSGDEAGLKDWFDRAAIRRQQKLDRARRAGET